MPHSGGAAHSQWIYVGISDTSYHAMGLPHRSVQLVRVDGSIRLESEELGGRVSVLR